jgi:hypothetical protein
VLRRLVEPAVYFVEKLDDSAAGFRLIGVAGSIRRGGLRHRTAFGSRLALKLLHMPDQVAVDAMISPCA